MVLEAKLLTVLARLPDALFMPDRFVNSKYDKYVFMCNSLELFFKSAFGWFISQEAFYSAYRK